MCTWLVVYNSYPCELKPVPEVVVALSGDGLTPTVYSALRSSRALSTLALSSLVVGTDPVPAEIPQTHS